MDKYCSGCSSTKSLNDFRYIEYFDSYRTMAKSDLTNQRQVNLEQVGIEGWWRWWESNPLHQNSYKHLILLDIIIPLKFIMGQV